MKPSYQAPFGRATTNEASTAPLDEAVDLADDLERSPR
jgi:hypothetical protein